MAKRPVKAAATPSGTAPGGEAAATQTAAAALAAADQAKGDAEAQAAADQAKADAEAQAAADAAANRDQEELEDEAGTKDFAGQPIAVRSATQGARRRAGRSFGPEPTEFEADELSDDEIAALLGDPLLIVELR